MSKQRHEWSGSQWGNPAKFILERDPESPPMTLYINGEEENPSSVAYATYAFEILNLAGQLQERDLFIAELIGRLGLDREAIDREGLPVGNEILKAIDNLLAEKKRLYSILPLPRRPL